MNILIERFKGRTEPDLTGTTDRLLEYLQAVGFVPEQVTINHKDDYLSLQLVGDEVFVTIERPRR